MTEGNAGALHLGRIDALVLREGDQQRLVSGKVVEHAAEEARIARRSSDVIWADAGGGQEAAKMFGLRREKAKRCNGQRLGGLVPSERILVLTSSHLLDVTRRLLPEIPAQNVLGEPRAASTGPALTWATQSP